MDKLKKHFLNSSMQSIFAIAIVFGTVITLNSCKDDEIIVGNEAQYLKYFPLEKGYWVEYQVDSIVHLDYDDLQLVDTAIREFHYSVREVVDSSFIDGENQKAFIILRYKRDNDSLPWGFSCVWTAKVNQFSAQKVEDNVRFVRLKFPIDEAATWNGNAYNYYPEEEYTYEDLYQPYLTGSLEFDSSITVIQNNFTSNINRIYKKEIYGPNAGLLFKQIDSVNTQIVGNATIILNGLEYQLNVTGYRQ